MLLGEVGGSLPNRARFSFYDAHLQLSPVLVDLPLFFLSCLKSRFF